VFRPKTFLGQFFTFIVLAGVFYFSVLPMLKNTNKFNEGMKHLERARYPLSFTKCLNNLEKGLGILAKTDLTNLDKGTMRTRRIPREIFIYIENYRYSIDDYKKSLQTKLKKFKNAEYHPLKAAELIVPTIQNTKTEVKLLAQIAESYLLGGDKTDAVRLAKYVYNISETRGLKNIDARMTEILDNPLETSKKLKEKFSKIKKQKNGSPPRTRVSYDMPKEWPTKASKRKTEKEMKEFFKKAGRYAKEGDLERAYTTTLKLTNTSTYDLKLKIISFVNILSRYHRDYWLPNGDPDQPDKFVFRLLFHSRNFIVKFPDF